MTIDVIIFTYKPGNKFLLLMDRLMKQTVMPQQIIIVNTERSLFEGLITEKEFLSKYPGTRMIHLAATEFDHGSSRNLGVSLSQADCFVLMTQDAVPASRNMIDRLTDRLIDGKTAVAYARQRPDRTSDRLERYTRRFNYGSKPLYKTGTDIAKMGIKTYFCSNACAAYNAKIFERLGGFVPQTIFNEDMIYAATAVAAGYAVAYRPEAAVYHAHDYTAIQQLKRNFDLGVSHADHPEIFSGLATESEGVRLVRATAAYLLQNKSPQLLIKLFVHSLAKYVGYFMGKHYRWFPRQVILRLSMNKNYWS